MSTLYLDVDTQRDFVFPAGSLYVPGAERILPRVAALNREAIALGHKLAATMDAHTQQDPEFEFWPHHCVKGTLGQRKADETIMPGMAIIEKTNVDCFTTPSMEAYLRANRIRKVIVYGVVTEICVKHAALGLLAREIEVEVRLDASKELDSAASALFLDQLRARGGVII